MFEFNRPMIAAHRGFSARYPENTMAAFRGAAHSGAQMIELDVTLSKDDEVVVIHDNTVDRTTNGSGPVNRLTLAELRQLDAGSWFQPRFFQEKIPTLKEVLREFNNKVAVNIEIKADGFGSMDSPDRLAQKVVSLVEEAHIQHRVLISSFSADMLGRVLAINAALSVAVLAEAPYDPRSLEQCMRLKAFSYHPELSLLDAVTVERCHAEGVFVFVWDVRSQKDVETCFRLNADGVIVDDPMMAVRQYRLL